MTEQWTQDEWGYDPEYVRRWQPLLDRIYDRWWRVTATGVDNIPSSGRALIVANHGGVLPWDAAMIATAIRRHHGTPRDPRFLVLDWAFDVPFASPAMRRFGGVPASPHNALRLLDTDHLVTVFPEGTKGTGKPYSQRYRLERFGRGGFVELALRAGAPIVPCAVVGSEDIYPCSASGGRWPGSRAFRSCRSHRRFRGSARSVSSRCPRAGGSSSARRSTSASTAPTRPATAPRCSRSPSRSAT